MDSVRPYPILVFCASDLLFPNWHVTGRIHLGNAIGVQAVRLVGFLKLGLHLKELGARKWESWLLWGLLLFSAVLMFLTNAVSTGTLQPIPITDGIFSFCYRRQ